MAAIRSDELKNSNIEIFLFVSLSDNDLKIFVKLTNFMLTIYGNRIFGRSGSTKDEKLEPETLSLLSMDRTVKL
ncbi:hypothetical protein DVH05_015146 [Phytophthora capsici]|nr:hypothetical protein DVH05_015146 [Phytophthora capsici]